MGPTKNKKIQHGPKVYIEDPRKVSENAMKSRYSYSTNKIIHTTSLAFSAVTGEPTTCDGEKESVNVDLLE
jgi:hypothetical protein